MEKKVAIFKNEQSSQGKQFIITPTMTLQEFKRCAAEKLNLKKIPKKVFTRSGQEITNIDNISAKENLYLSFGEPYFRSSSASADKITVSILGAGNVGKSAITLRFIRDAFIQNWEATIEDVYRKTTRVGDDVYMLEILDTAGQEDFSMLRPQWMYGRDGYIFVYSLVDKESMQTLYDLVDLLPQVCVRSPVPPILFVGNKADLVQSNENSSAVVSVEEVEKLIEHCRTVVLGLQRDWLRSMQQKHSDPQTSSANTASIPEDSLIHASPAVFIKHLQSSACDGTNIDEIFTSIIRSIQGSREYTKSVTNNDNSSKGRSRRRKESKWCWFL